MSDLTWTNCTATLGALKPWADNPRFSTKKQARALLNSWRDLGQFQTIAIGPDGEVYDGHQRLSALLTVHGADYPIDARRSNRALTDDERRRLVVTAHVGAVGSWDWDKLSGWNTATVGEWGMDADALKAWQTDAAALATMLEADKPAPVEDVEPQVDRAEELRVKWGVEAGQLWQLGDHRLICGDCTDRAVVERVMDGERADAVVTDPPYGMRLDTDFGSMKSEMFKGKTSGTNYKPVIGDSDDYDPSEMMALLPARETFLFGADYYAERIRDKNAGSWLVWDKRLDDSADKMYGSCFELCWSKRPHKRDVIRVKWAGIFGMEKSDTPVRVHPTQKPVGVIAWICERYTESGCVVADPYLGSGTTLIACERLGRKCRAIEIDPGYVAVALERWATATGKTPVLVV